MNRRRFLQGLGGAALAAPFLSSLEEKTVHAAGSVGPQRLVIFYTQNGCLTNRWFPSVENGALDASAFTGKTLAKLAPKANKLLFPRGFAMFPKGTINGYFDPHDQGMGSKLTCAPIAPDGSHYATARSLDHVAAELVNPGTKSPLVVSVQQAFGSNVKSVLSYSAANTPYLPEANLANIYKTLSSSFGSGTAAPNTPADYHIKRGNSMLDLCKNDLATMKRGKLSMADQKKIDDWAALMRQTEVKVVSAACNADNATALGITDANIKAAKGDAATQFTKGGDLLMEMIALTMMCDTNRMIVLQWPGFATFKWDGMNHEYDHHGLSHRNGSAAVGGTCVAGVIDMINQIDNWYAGKYAQLVNLIDSISEGDKTMLDNSAVMWLPELADGNAHNNNNLPIVIAGSMGGYLKQGQSINVDTKTLNTGNSEASCGTGTDVGFNTGSNTGNVPLNKLYVTLLNGLRPATPVTQFGVMDTSDVSKGITNPGEVAALKA